MTMTPGNPNTPRTPRNKSVHQESNDTKKPIRTPGNKLHQETNQNTRKQITPVKPITDKKIFL